MNARSYILISSITFISGIIFYCFTKNIIIIQRPLTQPFIESPIKVAKKKIQLFFWHNGSWNREETNLIWPEEKTQKLQYLLNAWLNLLDEEKINNKKVSLQSVALMPNGQHVLLSFNRHPFEKKTSSHEKLLWIEGLLKTIRENDVGIHAIQFLVHHRPMVDYHLDFSKPWPIEGFL